MTVCISDIHLSKTLVFDHETKNIVVFGNLTSDHDITFKVNNLIVLGKIISKGNITISTIEDTFNTGTIKGDIINIKCDSFYNGLSDTALDKIRSLEIDISRGLDGKLIVYRPLD